MYLPDPKKQVVYLRDARAFPVSRQTMEFREAVETGIAQHQPGESPVIISAGIQIIGIEAIRAARNVIENNTA